MALCGTRDMMHELHTNADHLFKCWSRQLHPLSCNVQYCTVLYRSGEFPQHSHTRTHTYTRLCSLTLASRRSFLVSFKNVRVIADRHSNHNNSHSPFDFSPQHKVSLPAAVVLLKCHRNCTLLLATACYDRAFRRLISDAARA